MAEIQAPERPAQMPMRWKVGHLLIVVLVAAIVLAIRRSLWGAAWRNATIVFGVYLACLVTATVGAWYAKPGGRRFWLGYAAFGWCWLALVLRHYLGMVPDVFASNKLDLSLLGMALGVLCALASQALPGMR